MTTKNLDAFLEDIYAHPLDDSPRLILADYLSEQNDPRGELIRMQCERGAEVASERFTGYYHPKCLIWPAIPPDRGCDSLLGKI